MQIERNRIPDELLDPLVRNHYRIRADVRQLEQLSASVAQARLAAAAELLREDYETDPELTAFTVLDGEDFLEYSCAASEVERAKSLDAPRPPVL